MAKVIDCPSKGEKDLAQLYLAGRLPEDQAESFEKHYFECESCWQDVQRGSELRAALGRPAVARAGAARSAWDWRPLAAAAVIAFVGLGVWQLTRRTAEEPARRVLRGVTAEGLDLKVEAGPQGSVNLTWSPHPDAATYQVEVLASDGVSVWKGEASGTGMSFERDSFPPRRPGISFLARVEALDTMHQVLAKSALVQVPNP